MGVSRLPAPPSSDTDHRWAPVAPIVISVAATAVSAAGVFLVRRPDGIGSFAGPFVYIAGMFGLVYATYRAVWGRARHFAALGVPEEWTRPPLRGTRNPDLRRWERTVREMREPLPDERDAILAAARARAEGLLAIEVPAALAVLSVVAMFLLSTRFPTVMPHFIGRGNLIPLVLVWMVLRYELIGARARAYLDRFGP